VYIMSQEESWVAMMPACLICFSAKVTLLLTVSPPVCVFQRAVPASSHGIM
jgi:hypothetical protein